MNFIFFKKYIISAVILFSIFSAPLVFAQSLAEEVGKQLNATAGNDGAGLGSYNDPRTIAVMTVRVGLGLLGTIFLVMVIYAGYLWMTAGGNEENIEKAKSLIYRGVIGLTIILAAASITKFAVDIALQRSPYYQSGVFIEPPPVKYYGPGGPAGPASP